MLTVTVSEDRDNHCFTVLCKAVRFFTVGVCLILHMYFNVLLHIVYICLSTGLGLVL